MSDNYFTPKPAQVNLDVEQEIIRYMRALLDLHDLLLNGYEYELRVFVHKLSDHGWKTEKISAFLELSSYHTRYESLIDPPIPEQGDRTEWDCNRGRWRS